MGVRVPCGQLASTGLVVAHVRLPALWPESSRASFYQCFAACRQHDVALCAFVSTYGRSLAVCLRRGALWLASVACGVRGLGVGAQGCVVRVFWDAGVACVRTLCARVQSPKSEVEGLVWYSAGAVCPGLDEQANGGDSSVCSLAAGFLAAATHRIGRPGTNPEESTGPYLRKNSVLYILCGCVCADRSGAGTGHCSDCGAAGLPPHQPRA